MNIYQTRKKYSHSNENTLFWRKTDETIWNPLFSKRTVPFQLTPYLWAIFSWPPFLSEFQKQKTPLILGGGTMKIPHSMYWIVKKLSRSYLVMKTVMENDSKIYYVHWKWFLYIETSCCLILNVCIISKMPLKVSVIRTFYIFTSLN